MSIKYLSNIDRSSYENSSNKIVLTTPYPRFSPQYPAHLAHIAVLQEAARFQVQPLLAQFPGTLIQACIFFKKKQVYYGYGSFYCLKGGYPKWSEYSNMGFTYQTPFELWHLRPEGTFVWVMDLWISCCGG